MGDRQPFHPSRLVQVLRELPGTTVDRDKGAYTKTCYSCQLIRARRGDRDPLSEDAFIEAVTELGGVQTNCADEIAVRYKQQLRLARKIGQGTRCQSCASEVAHVRGHRHCPTCGLVEDGSR